MRGTELKLNYKVVRAKGVPGRETCTWNEGSVFDGERVESMALPELVYGVLRRGQQLLPPDPSVVLAMLYSLS